MNNEDAIQTSAEAPAAATAPGADGAPVSDTPGFDKIAVIGNVVWLMTQSPHHRHLFLEDITSLVVGPVALGQYRIWRENGVPVGYASWATLDAEAEKRVRADVKSLKAEDWNSGDQLWLMDVIAPFGAHEKIVAELRETVFRDRRVKTLQPSQTGGMTVVEW